MSTKKTLSVIAAILFISTGFMSCSTNSVADEDSLYNNLQGVDKTEIVMPTNG
ncbi:hypothetical protein [Galbibacter sp. BG1]